MNPSIRLSIFDPNDNKLKEIDFFTCIQKLTKFQKVVLQNNLPNLSHYRLTFPVSQTNLDFFFESAEIRRSSNELLENITCFNIFEFYQLSREFEYQDFEEQIKHYIQSHQLSRDDIRYLKRFHCLDQSFFDQFISVQINSVLENYPNELDPISSTRLYTILSQSKITNMTRLCEYFLHRKNKFDANEEIKLNACLFSFVDCSTLSDNLIEQLTDLSDLYGIYIPNLSSQNRQLLNNNKTDFSNYKGDSDEQIESIQNENQSLKDTIKPLKHRIEVLEKENSNMNCAVQLLNSHSFKNIVKPSYKISKELTSITIPANVLTIDESVPSLYPNLKTISVDPNNPLFASLNGILYSKNLDQLIWFPSRYSSHTYKIPSTVSCIWSSAFHLCVNLQSITVESANLHFASIDGILFTKDFKTLIRIPSKHRFSTCIIPSSAQSIGDSAFSGCSNLQSIKIPTSVTSIGDSAFSGCSNLQSIKIPTSVTSIGKSAFSYCSKLQSITIPSSVTSIGTYIFSHCSNLESINVESNNLHFTSIDGILFTTNLETIVCFPAKHQFSKYSIPTSVTSIGDSAFYNCSNLQSITIPTSVTSIGNYIFSHCSNLESINVESNNLHFISIDGILFTKNLDIIVCFPPNHQFSKYSIPTSVTSIGDSAFSGCCKLRSITIPTSVTSIGKSAFSGCCKLRSITIPTSVTSIGESAFSSCSNLQSITIPSSVISIGDSAFYNCSNLQSVTIPTSVTSIGNSAFSYCSDLQSITIPTSVTSIGDYAFSGCSTLQSITIPTSVTSIGESAFSYCSNLQSITIPSSVTSIGNSAFSYCSDLQSITIPTSVTSIGDYAFSFCFKLQSINVESNNLHFTSIDGILFTKNLDIIVCFTPNHQFSKYSIPTSVTSIGDSAFSFCSNLQSITIPTSVTSIGKSAFSGCSNLQSITIPTSVTSIGKSAFPGCSNLQSITIPTSVTSIGDSAFSYCSKLQSITIPTSVTSIGESVFSSCSNLQSITISAAFEAKINSIFDTFHKPTFHYI